MTQKTVGSASSIATSLVLVSGGASPVKLVDARPGRRSLTVHLSNSGTNSTFYIGPNSSVGNSNGFHLYLDDYLTIETEAEIWGVWPTGSGSLAVTLLEAYD